MKHLGTLATLLVFLATVEKAVTKYEIIFDRLEAAFGEDDKVFRFDSLRIKKFNRTTFVMNGKFTIKQPLGTDTDGVAYIKNLQGGHYKQMWEYSVKDGCTTLYKPAFKSHFEDYQSHMTHPVAFNTCPYPSGSNEIKNYFVRDVENLLPPYVPGNEKWKIEIRVLRNGEVLGGYNFYGMLRSEQSLMWNDRACHCITIIVRQSKRYQQI